MFTNPEMSWLHRRVWSGAGARLRKKRTEATDVSVRSRGAPPRRLVRREPQCSNPRGRRLLLALVLPGVQAPRRGRRVKREGTPPSPIQLLELSLPERDGLGLNLSEIIPQYAIGVYFGENFRTIPRHESFENVLLEFNEGRYLVQDLAHPLVREEGNRYHGRCCHSEQRD